MGNGRMEYIKRLMDVASAGLLSDRRPSSFWTPSPHVQTINAWPRALTTVLSSRPCARRSANSFSWFLILCAATSCWASIPAVRR